METSEQIKVDFELSNYNDMIFQIPIFEPH
jgi:hypothetical protein